MAHPGSDPLADRARWLSGHRLLREGRILNREKIHQAKNFTLYSGVFSTPGVEGSRRITYVDQPEVAIAVPVLRNRQVVLVAQWRPLVGRTLLECPGGKVEVGETPESALQRELPEEIGLRPATLRPLGRFFFSVGASTERIHCFAATDFSPTERSTADKKTITVKVFEEAELLDMVRGGITPDGKTQIALTTYFSLMGP